MAPTPDPPYRSPRSENERRSYYKYVTAGVAKIILTTRKLRWSSPLLFNDPFDVNQELPLNFNEEEINKELSEQLASLIDTGDFSKAVGHPGLAVLLNAAKLMEPGARKKVAQEIRQSYEEVTSGQIESLAELKEKWRQIVPKLRIFCVSELNDVTPMWQHYADEYKGVVLRFESVDGIGNPFSQARKVEYQDFPIDISNVRTWARGLLAGEAALHELINKYQYIKATSWRYEEEWRIVGGDRAGETELFADYDFNPRELTSIYFGTLCLATDREEILSLLADDLDHVAPYEAFEDRYQGKFDFRPLTP